MQLINYTYQGDHGVLYKLFSMLVRLMACDAVSLDEYYSTFRKIVLLPSCDKWRFPTSYFTLYSAFLTKSAIFGTNLSQDRLHT